MAPRRYDIDDFNVHFMYYEEGMTQQEIANYYGVCTATISNRLHPEKKKESNKQWILKNSEYKKEFMKEYRLEHLDYDKEYLKEWWQSENGKLLARRKYDDRKGLGAIELNKPFPGSEGHHIDETYIIHIPKDLHRSVYHNVRTGQGVEEINTIAFQYITEEMFDNLIAGEI